MPIFRLLAREGFQPEEIAILTSVFEDVLTTLGLIDRQDPLTAMIAKKLIEIAGTGVRDPGRLKEMTMKAIDGKPPASSAA